jgi:hypothetical protein
MPSLFWKKDGVVHEHPLQTTYTTSPAFHVRKDGVILHADLEIGIPDTASLAFRYNGITYRLKRATAEGTAGQPTADIGVGIYNQATLFTMIKSYLTDGVTRSTTTGIALKIYSGSTLVNQYRNVSQWKWTTSSGGDSHTIIFPQNGEYNTGSGWVPFSGSQSRTANFFNNSAYSVSLETAMTFV